MPYYEFDYDIGVYGYVGNNGIKIICIKKIENSSFEETSEKKLKQLSIEIHSKFIKLLLNPFYEKKEFFEENSRLRETFANNIINLTKLYQMV